MIVFLDTNIVIYIVENPPVLGARAIARFAALQAGGDTFMVSDLTRMECQVGPLRNGDVALVQQFRKSLSGAAFQVVPITTSACDRAAHIRASERFPAMDSLHLAAAVEHGASRFLTLDAHLAKFSGLPVEVLP